MKTNENSVKNETLEESEIEELESFLKKKKAQTKVLKKLFTKFNTDADHTINK